ncbi:ras association domain-containing protein 2-like [Liolophura sinensis]|uniref:ras association domain-containing protein 2-like n=1 Tax=Liolophura sinensis TaxID=3198878 RepID=UPI003158CA07
MPVNGQANSCRRCSKPVFFAERKTSLGEDWHPSCLSCENCNKVLAPGQHAEHKGLPFCNPCYQTFFGPQMVGYGSNVFTAANFNKRISQNGNSNNNNNNNDVQDKGILRETDRDKKSDLQAKLEAYNSQLTNGRSHCRLSEEKNDKVIQSSVGPEDLLGFGEPIQLKQCDEVNPIPSPAPSRTWRHSYYHAIRNGALTPTKEDISLKTPPKVTISRGLDDSALLSPSTSDDTTVVLRRNRGIRKFNTVAYRGDQGNRWKRASINGHIYNNDTRVFVPVIGSCTSVTVTSAMPTSEVIRTLLEKFKVENQPGEYSLYIVPDEGEPTLLRESEFPLIEKLLLGCDEKAGKVFIKEKTVPEVPTEAWNTLPLPEVVEPRVPENVSFTEVTEIQAEPQEQLPEEVEQLVNLPEAVLRGLLQKFRNDEELEVSRIQKKYERARDIMKKRLRESQA